MMRPFVIWQFENSFASGAAAQSNRFFFFFPSMLSQFKSWKQEKS